MPLLALSTATLARPGYFYHDPIEADSEVSLLSLHCSPPSPMCNQCTQATPRTPYVSEDGEKKGKVLSGSGALSDVHYSSDQ